MYPIKGAQLCIESEMGRIIDTLNVRYSCGRTNASGVVEFFVEFASHDKASDEDVQSNDFVFVGVPEPGTLAVIALGSAGLLFRRRRR